MLTKPKKENYGTGFVPLQEWINIFNEFRNTDYWRLPLGLMDKFHFYLLTLILRFSWFSDRIYIKKDRVLSPVYEVIINYLSRQFGGIKIIPKLSILGDLKIYQWRIFIKGNNRDFSAHSFGSSSTSELALSKAIGEGVERFFTLRLKPHEFTNIIEGTVLELKNQNKNYYLPNQYHHFTSQQIINNSFLYQDKGQVITWVNGHDLVFKKNVLLPLQIVSASCQKLLAPNEGVMMETTTSGGAGWFTKDGAILRGLLELVQRDAILVPWLKKESLNVINQDSINDNEIKNLLIGLKKVSAKITILNVPNILNIPTVAVVVNDLSFGEEQVYVTAHTDINYQRAVLGALYEAVPFFFKRKLARITDSYKPFVTKDINRTVRLNLAGDGNLLKVVERFKGGVEIDYKTLQKFNLDEASEEMVLNQILERCKKLGSTFYPYIYEYKNPILKKLNYHVVKVFVPSLFPLYLTEHLAPIQSSRLFDFNQNLNVDIRDEIETVPHPLL